MVCHETLLFNLVLPQFEIIKYFDFSKYIIYTMYPTYSLHTHKEVV